MRRKERMSNLWELVTRSSIRKRSIISLLKSGPLQRRDLKEKTGASHTSTLIKEVNKLVDTDLVEETSMSRNGSPHKGYELTSLGETISSSLQVCTGAISLIEKDLEFWSKHHLSGIPIQFRKRLNELTGGEIISSSPTDIEMPLQMFLENLKASSKVKGISPIYHSAFIPAISELSGEGVPVSLVLTDDVIEKLVETSEIKTLISSGVEIRVPNVRVGLSLTVTDCFLSLGLFRNNGTYDVSSDFQCNTTEAVKWGEDLFEYFRERSSPLETLSRSE